MISDTQTDSGALSPQSALETDHMITARRTVLKGRGQRLQHRAATRDRDHRSGYITPIVGREQHVSRGELGGLAWTF